MATWTTFAPSFLWILTGAPFIERLRSLARLASCLSAVTAAVVGVISSLAVWFATEVLLPVGQTMNGFALVVFVAALLALQKLKIDVTALVAICAVAGVVWKMVFRL